MKNGTLMALMLVLLTSCAPDSKLPPISSMPEDLQPYVEGLRNENPDMRWQAAQELGFRGSESKPAMPFLIAALCDTNERVQLFSVMALGAIGPEAKEALPALERLAQETSSEDLKRAVKKAVFRIRRT